MTNPLLDLFKRGTICELTDIGRHFTCMCGGSPDRRFVVQAITFDGKIACRSEDGFAYTLSPHILRPVTDPAPFRPLGPGWPGRRPEAEG